MTTIEVSKEQMIEKIYQEIADKILSFGCYYIEKSTGLKFRSIGNETTGIIEIIGHPVLIGRCDILIEKGPNYFDEWIVILDLWEKKDEPIENQNEECITYIYNLIK